MELPQQDENNVDFLNDFEHGKFTKSYNIKIHKYLLQINYSIDVSNNEDNVFPVQLSQNNNNAIITTAQTTTLPLLQGQKKKITKPTLKVILYSWKSRRKFVPKHLHFDDNKVGTYYYISIINCCK